MSWSILNLAKHIFGFTSSAFDVGSDIANSMNFLGFFNYNTTYSSITSLALTSLTQPITSNTTMRLSATSEMSLCATTDEREDLIWGIFSLLIVFLPGFIFGTTMTIQFILEDDWSYLFLFTVFAIPIISVGFPFLFLWYQLLIIVRIWRNDGIDKLKTPITQFLGFEATVESTPQLLLQLFTIFNGYQSTLVQEVAIAASFFQIARCSILNDIETKIAIVHGEELSFKDSLLSTMYRLPMYASTIIFRVGSLAITMAYFRYLSLIPIAILLVTQTMIAWTRYKKLRSAIGNTKQLTFLLVASNIGAVNALPPGSQNAEEDQNVVQFIKNSTLASFIHHSALLIFIMTVAYIFPDAMNHWSSSCNFRLKPGTHAFWGVFGVVFLMGIFSLTTILYRARLMVKIGSKPLPAPIFYKDLELLN